MPQGKGTYGSKVGRPPKKKYQEGGKVLGQEAVMEAAKMGQDLKSIGNELSLENMPMDVPTSDATQRSQTYQMGGEVGKGIYKEGGKVKEKANDRVLLLSGPKAGKRWKEVDKANKEFKKEYSKRRKKADKQTKKALKAKDPSSSTNILDIHHDILGSEIKMEKISKKRNTH